MTSFKETVDNSWLPGALSRRSTMWTAPSGTPKRANTTVSVLTCSSKSKLMIS